MTKIPSVTFQKRYKNAGGDWQSTQSLNVVDIPKAVIVLNESYRFLSLKEDRDAC